MSLVLFNISMKSFLNGFLISVAQTKIYHKLRKYIQNKYQNMKKQAREQKVSRSFLESD